MPKTSEGVFVYRRSERRYGHNPQLRTGQISPRDKHCNKHYNNLKVRTLLMYQNIVDFVWNVMAHGDAREEKWRGNKRMEWVTSKRHVTAEHRLARAVQTLQPVYSSPASSRLNWPYCRFKLTRPFRGKRNLVAARVPSHFKRSLPTWNSFC